MGVGRLLTQGLGTFSGRQYLLTQGLSTGLIVPFVPVPTRRLTMIGTSAERLALESTSGMMLTMMGTSGNQLDIHGTSGKRKLITGTSENTLTIDGTAR